jgi:hypothetical protein
MVSNTDDIDKLDDGRMIASGWKGYTCKRCDSYHIDLLDKAGETFATLVIEEEDLFVLADKLLDTAEGLFVPDGSAEKLH